MSYEFDFPPNLASSDNAYSSHNSAMLGTTTVIHQLHPIRILLFGNNSFTIRKLGGIALRRSMKMQFMLTHLLGKNGLVPKLSTIQFLGDVGYTRRPHNIGSVHD